MLLLFCIAAVVVYSLKRDTHDPPAVEQALSSTGLISVGTWNILDLKGTYAERYGCPKEIEQSAALGKTVAETKRRERIQAELQNYVREHQLEVLGLQELQAGPNWAEPIMETMTVEGFTTICQKGELALFVKEGNLRQKSGCMLDYTDKWDKYKQGLCVTVFDTQCGQTVAFTNIHVSSKMRKQDVISEWATNLKTTIQSVLTGDCVPDHIVVMADFNTELNRRKSDLEQAGWAVKTVPTTAPFPFTTEHEYGKEQSIDGFLTFSYNAAAPIGWSGHLQNEMKGFMSKAIGRFEKQQPGMVRKSKYSYDATGNLLREDDGGVPRVVGGKNKVEDSLSDHLLVYGNLQLPGCSSATVEKEVADPSNAGVTYASPISAFLLGFVVSASLLSLTRMCGSSKQHSLYVELTDQTEV